jgi:hypothetical protein
MPAASKVVDVAKKLIKPSTGKVVAQSVEDIGKKYPKPESFFKDPAGAVWRSIAPNKFLATTRGLATHPIKTMKAGWKSPKLSKFQIALMSAFSAPDIMALAKKQEPGEPSKGERLGRLAGSWAGMTAYSRLPFLGNMLGWMGGEYLGGKAGKLGQYAYDKAKSRSVADKMEHPSAVSKTFSKAAAAKLRKFTREKIKLINKEIPDNARVLGDIQTVTWRDPTGTFERQVSTENRPHA